ncbi:unnamed protein product [Prunus brigantina]
MLPLMWGIYRRKACLGKFGRIPSCLQGCLFLAW